MALIKCSECGKDVSDTAKNCPHCGNVIGTPVPQVDQKEKTAKLIAIVASAGVAVFSFLPFLQLSYYGYATPRSWEMVSNLLNTVDDCIGRMYPLIAGLIGTGVATEFRMWERVYSRLPDIEKIFDGMMPTVPDTPDALYALCSAMTSYAASHKDDKTRISNSIRYALRLPPDFSVVLMKDYFMGQFSRIFLFTMISQRERSSFT